MKAQVGIWIDQREAIIVTLKDQIEAVEHIESGLEESVSDADAPHVSQQDRHNKRIDAHLSKYYGKIITLIHNAEAILLFGPGETKHELQKKLERRGLSKQIVAVETTDSMTEAQIVAKVRQYFIMNETLS